MLLIAIFAIRAFSYIVLHYTSNHAILYTFAVVFGFVDYSVVPPVISLTHDTLGKDIMGYVAGHGWWLGGCVFRLGGAHP